MPNHLTTPLFGRALILWLLAGVLLALLVLPRAAGAEVTKLYNAAHSLTGGCTTNSADPIPDPGCPDGPQPPEGKLREPSSVVVDGAGAIYVLNENASKGEKRFHIDVFGPDGHYLTSVEQPGAEGIAVDSSGHLYVYAEWSAGYGGDDMKRLVRFDPTVYKPASGEIEYGNPPVVLREYPYITLYGPESASRWMAVDPTDNHLFFVAPLEKSFCSGCPVERRNTLVELAAPTAGLPNALVSETPIAITVADGPIAFDLSRHRLYAVDTTKPGNVGGLVIKVFDSDASYGLLETIDASNAPPQTAGLFDDFSSRFSLAVDEETGDIFVGRLLGQKKLFELDENFDFVGSISKPSIENQRGPIAIDNSEASPNRGYLYVPSGQYPAGNLFAYEPKFEPKPPEVTSPSFDGLTETEAVLGALVNPKGLPAHWVAEYTPQQAFEANGFVGAQTAGEGDLAASGSPIAVAAPATGLVPGTRYRFRVRAENKCAPAGCGGEAQGSFATFGAAAQAGNCANEGLRIGLSAGLPDCRAYELVTPADTNGLLPYAPANGSGGPKWGTPPASPGGGSFAFMIFGGLIPGMDATGGPTEIGDTYVSTRGPDGWSTQPKSPTGAEANRAYTGGLSGDHGYMPLEAAFQGSLPVGGARTTYVRLPDGSYILPGQGSLGTAIGADVRYISPGGSHTIFVTPPSESHLEPDAPPTGTAAIYDRTPDGVLHVVSLLPGEVTPAAGENAVYVGASADGSAVAFTFGSAAKVTSAPLYLRVGDVKTYLAAPAGIQFAGISADGRYLFYQLGGDLYRFDSAGDETEQITSTGDVEPVNVGAAGTGAYYLSPTALPTGANPVGSSPEAGAHNLYYWDGADTHFVAKVTGRDAAGEHGIAVTSDGLGLWLQAAGADFPAVVSSRTTPDSSVLLFESRANLTGSSSAGKAQIYRYDAGADDLRCLSCDPTGAGSAGEARLIASVEDRAIGLGPSDLIANLDPSGDRAFFETDQRLVAADNDSLADVYEWESQGTGTCAQPGGCVFLISSGQSGRAEHLVGVSKSGDDVFILSADLLTAEDRDDTPSVYDARVGGGFPPPPSQSGGCLGGEACQPFVAAPALPSISSLVFHGAGNVTKKVQKRCPAGRRNVRMGGKSRCVSKARKHRKHRKHQQRTSAKRGAQR